MSAWGLGFGLLTAFVVLLLSTRSLATMSSHAEALAACVRDLRRG